MIAWRIEDGNWSRVLKYFEHPVTKQRAERLKADVKHQFKLGNQGKFGEWLE